MKFSTLFRWMFILGAAGVGYVHACRMLSKQQSKILYQPSVLEAGHEDYKDVLFVDQETSLKGWVENIGQRQALIYFGGSSEQVELRRSIVKETFPSHTIYFVPYRGFGPNHQLQPQETLIKSDAEKLFLNIQQLHEHTDIIGRSLGTSIAVHVASRHKASHLALITPFSSVLDIAQERYKWAPVKYLLKDCHEVWKDAPLVDTPIFVGLAQTDIVTPRKFWEKLHPHFKTNCFVTEYHCDHNTIAFEQKMWNDIASFFKEPL